MASIEIDSEGDRWLSGPLFNGDLLALAEEILDLKRSSLQIDRDRGSASTLADRLIMLDIAKSLRLLCDAPGVQSYHSRYGNQHKRQLPLPDRPVEF